MSQRRVRDRDPLREGPERGRGALGDLPQAVHERRGYVAVLQGAPRGVRRRRRSRSAFAPPAPRAPPQTRAQPPPGSYPASRSRRTPAERPTRRRLRGRSRTRVRSEDGSIGAIPRKKRLFRRRRERRIGAGTTTSWVWARRRRNRDARGNVEGAGVVVCAFGSGSFGNLARVGPADAFAASPPPGTGESTRCSRRLVARGRVSVACRVDREVRTYPSRPSCYPPLSSCRRWSGTTALRQLPTRSRLAAKSDGRQRTR